MTMKVFGYKNLISIDFYNFIPAFSLEFYFQLRTYAN